MGRQLKTGSLILMVLLCFACKDQTKTADKDTLEFWTDKPSPIPIRI